MINIKIFLILLGLGNTSYCLFSDLEHTFTTERAFINKSINLLIEYQSKLSDIIRSLDFNSEPNNPIQEYFLLKEFYRNETNMEKIKNLLKLRQIEFINNPTEIQLDTNFNVQLNQLTINVARLQDIYNITVTNFIKGQLCHFKSKYRLLPNDCFEIGKSLVSNKQFDLAVDWFKNALSMLDNKTYDKNLLKNIYFEKTDILLNLAESIVRNVPLTSVLDSLSVIWDMFAADVTNDQILEKLIKYREFMKNFGQKSEDEPLHKGHIENTKRVKAACRGELQQSSQLQRNLFCRYKTNSHPFLMLAPIKMEYINLNPLVAVFHEMISDKEIDIIKTISKDKLENAMVYDTNASTLSLGRVSKLFWFFDDLHPIVSNINQRVEDATGLSTDSESSEALQVNKYTFGGWYDAHYDTFEDSPLINRIATLMFYLSDVVEGGSTVFPYANVSMLPQKGSAIFWFNTLPNGKNDYNTLHSGCPVVVGTKWVANKWFRLREQVLKMPCKKNENDVWTVDDV